MLVVAAPLIAAGVLTGSRALAAAGGVAFLAGATGFSLVLGYSWLPVTWRGRRPPQPVEPR
jgi:hypothetical protein